MTTAFLLVAFSFGQIPLSGNPSSPAGQVEAAYRDLLTLPANVQPYIRYLTLYNVPADKRQLPWRVMSGHVNGLSREPDIVAPVQIGNLIRLNIQDYGWSKELWEKLAEADPYFHAFITVEEEVLIDQPYGVIDEKTGKWRQTEIRKEKEKKKVRKFSASAPWLVDGIQQAATIKALIELTQSQCPILRGDWFFSQTAIQADRNPGYYDFLGIKNRKDFEKLVGFDAKLAAESRRKELLEAVSDSGVTQQPRRIGRFEAIGGMGYWRTFDNRRALDERNPLRILDDKNFKFDASEEYGALPNHLWATGLFAANGDRQDSAPDFIAADHTSKSNDHRVHVNLSCLRCHGPNAGMQPIDGWLRNLVQAPLALQSPDYEVLKDLRQKYLRDMANPQEDDRRLYTRSLKEATGLNPKQYSEAYGEFWSRYEDERVDADRAAVELGTTKQSLLAAIDGYIRKTGSVDTVLSVLLRGGTIGRRQFEEAYGTGQLVLRGIVQP